MKARSFNFKPHYPNPIFGASTRDLSIDREEMILKHIPLVKYIARRLAMRLPPNVSVEDLFSAGVIGLMDALNKFDSGKKVQFKTYAEIRIKGAMLDEIRSQDCVSRSVRQKATQLEKAFQTLQKKKGRRVEDEEVAQELGLSLEAYYDIVNQANGVSFLDMENDWGLRWSFSDEDLPDQICGIIENPIHLLHQEETKKIISNAIEELSIKERMVISLYYYEDLTLNEIAQILGFTESRICQIHSKTILKLKSKIGNYFDGIKSALKSPYEVKRRWKVSS